MNEFEVGSNVTVVSVARQSAIDFVVETLGKTGVLIENAKDNQPYLVRFGEGMDIWYFEGELE